MSETDDFLPARVISSMIRSDRELLNKLLAVREDFPEEGVRSLDDLTAEVPESALLEPETVSAWLEILSEITSVCARRKRILRTLAEKLRGQ